MSMFDPDAFMSTNIEGELSTSIPPIPEMEEALLVIKSVDPRVAGKDKDVIVLDVTFVVDEQEAREATGMDEPSVRSGIFLDILDDGSLDTTEGKNVGLGRLRAAVNQNSAAAWNPAMLIGQVLRGKITQRPEEDGDRIFNDVKQFKAAA